ncbi:putative tetratricopeptide-like helical domain-containing protein [Rosa chinensis]|uniref:Putative tetratricopeptide-like helical domain-containing protein n=1 Tax=Rosa chinensis TaxID=74649 RepID=A0A2P6Q369_ROSCH|nr:crooked neck-like protein 1 [Rosa chinensis]PRQ28623.1 putative tetratricopeptide-like helical domain-containing protein [Rosa chinensis]
MVSDKDTDDLTRKNKKVNLPRPSRVKNKTPAPIQITAEQILREAREQQEPEFRPPKQKITDPTELADDRLRKRKLFEDQVRRARQDISVWIKYATWEEKEDLNRASSVWERALEVDYRNHTLWIKYAEMEIKNEYIDHARNVLDRAVQLLPRVDRLWYKYIHMEEMTGNVAGARHIFERWMTWMPEQEGWLSYVKFEVRYNEVERARGIFERFVQCHPGVGAWIRYAKFEVKNGGDVVRAGKLYERAVEILADDEEAEQLFLAFAEFEEKCKDIDRARCVYKFALDRIPKGRAQDLYKKFVCFEKRYGDREGIEDAVVGTRRFEYEDEIRKNPLNYDSWFDYIRLEESAGNKERIREVYERAVANVPPANEKRYWKRYIYLWINYALYEELDTGEVERAREVYRECLNLIPHKKFSFAKIWILAAEFEIRQLNLTGARHILGTAIGKAPKEKIFKKYIEIELQLAKIDRCRKLYDKYLLWNAQSCYVWIKYAEFEKSLGETERARALFELAISQLELDNPELVWISYAKFEAEAPAKDDDDLLEEKRQCIKRARRVFERALDYFITSAPDKKEERNMLLEEWLNMEASFGDLGGVSLVQPKLPKKLKKRRQTITDDGPAGYEEYIDYLFPEESATTNLKILEAAYRWRKKTKFSSDED